MIRLAPILALVLAGCSAQPAPRGDGHPPTIVSLNPCTDAILAEVALPGQLLAISHYSKHPRSSSMEAATARRFPATGGTVEEVLALNPDMVVAGSFLAPATRVALEDMGLRVVLVGMATDVDDSMAQVREMAALAGNPSAGERLVNRIEGALAAARPKAGQRVDTVLWQPDGIVPGGEQLISVLMANAGLDNQSAERGMAQADYLSLEQVVADPPQLLLVAGSERGQRHPVLEELPDMTRASFDPALLYCGGPTIIRASERLAQLRDIAGKPGGDKP